MHKFTPIEKIGFNLNPKKQNIAIRIEIKGGHIFDYPDYSNYLGTTNNEWTVKMDKHDGRIAVFECNGFRQGQHNYFKSVMDTFSQDTANHFYSYIYHNLFGDVCEIRNIPSTDLRKRMIQASLSISEVFINHVRKLLNNCWVETQLVKDGHCTTTSRNLSLWESNLLVLTKKNENNKFEISTKNLYRFLINYIDPRRIYKRAQKLSKTRTKK